MIETMILATLTVGVIWFCIVVGMNDYYSGQIDGYLAYWQSIARRVGMQLTSEPGGFDDAPCEAKFKLEGRWARVVCGPWKMIRILRGLRDGRIEEKQLVSISIWQTTRLPR